MKKFKQFIIKHIDKVLHFSGSYIIASVFYALIGIWGLLITLGIGIAIEIIDSKSEKNYFSWLDLLADVVGIGTALLLFLLMMI